MGPSSRLLVLFLILFSLFLQSCAKDGDGCNSCTASVKDEECDTAEDEVNNDPFLPQIFCNNSDCEAFQDAEFNTRVNINGVIYMAQEIGFNGEVWWPVVTFPGDRQFVRLGPEISIPDIELSGSSLGEEIPLNTAPLTTALLVTAVICSAGIRLATRGTRCLPGAPKRMATAFMITILFFCATSAASSFKSITVPPTVAGNTNITVRLEFNNASDTRHFIKPKFKVYLSQMYVEVSYQEPNCYLLEDFEIQYMNTTSFNITIPSSVNASGAPVWYRLIITEGITYTTSNYNQGREISYSNSFRITGGTGTWTWAEIGLLNPEVDLLTYEYIPCTSYECARNCTQTWYPGNWYYPNGFEDVATYNCTGKCRGVKFPLWREIFPSHEEIKNPTNDYSALVRFSPVGLTNQSVAPPAECTMAASAGNGKDGLLRGSLGFVALRRLLDLGISTARMWAVLLGQVNNILAGL